MPSSIFLKGTILTNESVLKGYIEIQNGQIIETREGSPPQNANIIAKGLIMPRLFNSHVHIGDNFLYPAPKMSVEELVAPPNGYKHRKLQEATQQQLEKGITEALDTMLNSGTYGFMDFREGGTEGIKQFQTTFQKFPLKELINPITLGRPRELNYDQEEICSIQNTADGFGLSGINDWKKENIQNLSEQIKTSFFAIHASEREREPIDNILDLKPDMLIHCAKATKDDLEIIKDSHIPIVLCLQSNEFFGIKRDLKTLIESGVTLLGGTDNGMITRPQCIEEMNFFVQKCEESKTPISHQLALDIFTTSPSKVLNDKKLIADPSPSMANLMVLQKEENGIKNTFDPFGIVRSFGSEDIRLIIHGNTMYHPGME